MLDPQLLLCLWSNSTQSLAYVIIRVLQAQGAEVGEKTGDMHRNWLVIFQAFMSYVLAYLSVSHQPCSVYYHLLKLPPTLLVSVYHLLLTLQPAHPLTQLKWNEQLQLKWNEHLQLKWNDQLHKLKSIQIWISWAIFMSGPRRSGLPSWFLYWWKRYVNKNSE